MENPVEAQAALYGDQGPPIIYHEVLPSKSSKKRTRKRRKLKKSSVTAAEVLMLSQENLRLIRQGEKVLSASSLPGDFPPELAFRALSIYGLLRTLSRELRLSPFTPNVFLRSLYLPYANKLIGQVHVALLRVLLPYLKMGYNYKARGGGVQVYRRRTIDNIRWPLRAGDNLAYLDEFTWPLFYDDYCHLTADRLWSSLNDQSLHVDFRNLGIQNMGITDYDEESEDDEKKRKLPQEMTNHSQKLSTNIKRDTRTAPPNLLKVHQPQQEREKRDSESEYESEEDVVEAWAPRGKRRRSPNRSEKIKSRVEAESFHASDTGRRQARLPLQRKRPRLPTSKTPSPHSRKDGRQGGQNNGSSTSSTGVVNNAAGMSYVMSQQSHSAAPHHGGSSFISPHTSKAKQLSVKESKHRATDADNKSADTKPVHGNHPNVTGYPQLISPIHDELGGSLMHAMSVPLEADEADVCALKEFTAGKREVQDDGQSSEDSYGKTPSDDHWSHFVPLREMRSGVAYHKLAIEHKVRILEYIVDELLSVDSIGLEMRKRHASCSGLETPFGKWPTADEYRSLDNADECAVCGQEGDLLCCDGCVASYHGACLGMGSGEQLPEGKWLCPECNLVDPSKVGPLSAGRKASLDWIRPGYHHKVLSSHTDQESMDLGLYEKAMSTVAPMEDGHEYLILHGFVFKRSKQLLLMAAPSPFPPDNVVGFRESFGKELSHTWPLAQIPTVTIHDDGHFHSVRQYLASQQSFDPSSYSSKYRKAPVPAWMKVSGCSVEKMADNSLSKLNITSRISDVMAPDFTFDKILASNLSLGSDLHDPYQQVRTYMFRLETALKKACLLCEFWESGKRQATADIWKRRVRQARSVNRLAPLLLTLVDRIHTRAFVDVWHHVPALRSNQAIEEPDRKFEEISVKWSKEKEKRKRTWERCTPDVVLSTVEKDDGNLALFVEGVKHDVQIQLSHQTRSKRKKVFRTKLEGVQSIESIEATSVTGNILPVMVAPSDGMKGGETVSISNGALSSVVPSDGIKEEIIIQSQPLVQKSDAESRVAASVTDNYPPVMVTPPDEMTEGETVSMTNETLSLAVPSNEIKEEKIIQSQPLAQKSDDEQALPLGNHDAHDSQQDDVQDGTDSTIGLSSNIAPKETVESPTDGILTTADQGNFSSEKQTPGSTESSSSPGKEEVVAKLDPPAAGKSKPKAKKKTKSHSSRRPRRSGRLPRMDTIIRSQSEQLNSTGPQKYVLSVMEMQIEEYKQNLVPEMEKKLKTSFQKELHWPVAGRKLFSTLGDLPPKQMQYLGRNAGKRKAAYVAYSTSHEVGQVCSAYVWRKKTAQCSSLEELLYQIRMLDSFLDKASIQSIENAVRRGKSQVQRKVQCCMRDPPTGKVHYFIVHKTKQKGCWFPAEDADVAPFVVEQLTRRQNQIGIQNLRAQVIRKEAAAKARDDTQRSLPSPAKRLKVDPSPVPSRSVNSNEAYVMQMRVAKSKEKIQLCLSNHRKQMRQLLQQCVLKGILPVPQALINKVRERSNGFLQNVLAELGGLSEQRLKQMSQLLAYEESQAVAEMTKSGSVTTPQATSSFTGGKIQMESGSNRHFRSLPQGDTSSFVQRETENQYQNRTAPTIRLNQPSFNNGTTQLQRQQHSFPASGLNSGHGQLQGGPFANQQPNISRNREHPPMYMQRGATAPSNNQFGSNSHLLSHNRNPSPDIGTFTNNSGNSAPRFGSLPMQQGGNQKLLHGTNSGRFPGQIPPQFTARDMDPVRFQQQQQYQTPISQDFALSNQLQSSRNNDLQYRTHQQQQQQHQQPQQQMWMQQSQQQQMQHGHHHSGQPLRQHIEQQRPNSVFPNGQVMTLQQPLVQPQQQQRSAPTPTKHFPYQQQFPHQQR